MTPVSVQRTYQRANGAVVAVFPQARAVRPVPRRARRQSMRRCAADVARAGRNGPHLGGLDCGPGVIVSGGRLANLAPRDRIGDIRYQGRRRRWRAGAVCGWRGAMARRRSVAAGPAPRARRSGRRGGCRLLTVWRALVIDDAGDDRAGDHRHPWRRYHDYPSRVIVEGSIGPSLRSGLVASRPLGNGPRDRRRGL